MAVTTQTELVSEQEWSLLKEDLGLSSRQAEIVYGILHAKSDKQIASELDISLPTVRTHMARLFQRFDLNDRVELLLHVLVALREYWQRKTTAPLEN